MAKLNVKLHWHGPLKVGTMPDNQADIIKRGLLCPGIYIYFQKYPRVTGIYAGQTNTLAHRIHDHLAGFLAFGYYLRVDDPDPASSPENRKIVTPLEDPNSGNTYYKYTHPDRHGLGCFNNLHQSVEHSMREVERLSFFYCPYLPDHDPALELDGLRGMEPDGQINQDTLITWLEASMIYDLKAEEDKGQSLTWVCDNERKEPKGGDHVNAVTHFVDGKRFECIISLIDYLQDQLS